MTGVRLVSNELVEIDGVVRAVPTDNTNTIETALVLRSIGYRGSAIADLPFDEESHVISNVEGRVSDAPRTYAVGWIKRGPSGFIGTNKSCAQETVQHLIGDHNAGLLPISGTPRSLAALAAGRARTVDLRGWRAIDRTERDGGGGRPRRKLTTVDSLLDAAAARPSRRRVLSGFVRG